MQLFQVEDSIKAALTPIKPRVPSTINQRIKYLKPIKTVIQKNRNQIFAKTNPNSYLPESQNIQFDHGSKIECHCYWLYIVRHVHLYTNLV